MSTDFSRHLRFAGANTYSIQIIIPHHARTYPSWSVHPENSLKQRNLQAGTHTWKCRCLIISIQSTRTDVCIKLKLSPSSKLCSSVIPPLPVCLFLVFQKALSHTVFLGTTSPHFVSSPFFLSKGKMKIPSPLIFLLLGSQSFSC